MCVKIEKITHFYLGTRFAKSKNGGIIFAVFTLPSFKTVMYCPWAQDI